jgi:hypothetical protein
MGGDVGYGFSLWIMPPDLPNCYHASGVKGNYIINDPTNDLVLVVTNEAASHPTAPDYLRAAHKALRQ